ncbi:MAG: hypothetical protein JW810_00030 [Sedimentisphaerales bacterium]|nr:hypothetical protein [Sedimentisphaerales bacterium]
MAAPDKPSHRGMGPICLIWTVALLGALLAGLIFAWDHTSWQVSSRLRLVGRISLGLACWCTLLGVAFTGLTLISALRKLQAATDLAVGHFRRLVNSESQKQALLTQISENILLSDAVKSVAFREKDSTVLREAIQEDIRTERWSSAEVLIDALQTRFGLKEEAQALREELQRSRRFTVEEKIHAAIGHIESLWMIHRYDEALRESEKLAQLYPRDESVTQLQSKTQIRRQAHKKELLARWDEAVRNNDFDQGIELLELLDNYLTPSEAAALEESARGVFRGKLHNMGVQFSLFVTERQWSKALDVGRRIIEDFPNSRMAQEVREKLQVLEQRAH